jgi:hypothetical protein
MRPCNGQRVLHNSIASVVATKQGDFRVGSCTIAIAIHCCLRIVPVCRAHGARMYWIHLCAPQAHKSHVLQLVTSPDQTMLATMSSDHTVKIWSLDSLTLQQTLAGHTRWVSTRSLPMPSP